MNSRDCGILFDTSPQGAIDKGWQSGVLRYRAKTIKAGDMKYCEAFPIWDTAGTRKASERIKQEKKKGSTEFHRRINARNAKKRLTWKVNENFGPEDLLCTFTYPDNRQPKSAEEAQRNIKNYVRRIAYYRNAQGLPDLKYVYVTETTQSAVKGTRYHHHMIMNGDGIRREVAEDIWFRKHHGLCNTRRYQEQDKALTGFALYMVKSVGKPGDDNIATKRKWCCSKNLKQPAITTADKKISRRRVEQIALDVEANAKEIFEKIYPGYRFIEAAVKTSQFVTGAYMYVTMKRIRPGGE